MGKRKGFTLVELIVVMAIIGILSAIAIPNYTQYVAKAKQTALDANATAIYQAVLVDYISQTSEGGYDEDSAAIDLSGKGFTVDNGVEADATKWIWDAEETGTAPNLELKVTVYSPTSESNSKWVDGVLDTSTPATK